MSQCSELTTHHYTVVLSFVSNGRSPEAIRSQLKMLVFSAKLQLAHPNTASNGISSRLKEALLKSMVQDEIMKYAYVCQPASEATDSRTSNEFLG